MRRLVSNFVALGLLLVVATPAGSPGRASAPAGAAALDFVPLIAVAPDDPVAGNGTPACTTPAPTITYAFYHCYTPAQMATAYGVDRLHAEGLTGAGETIIIVDSYGSPTALHDLQTFSAAFGLPQPDLTIYYPDGAPTYSPALHGIQANWAFETSLDLQWAHAMAPDARLVLVAANPAETQGVQGFPSMFRGEQWAISHYPGAVMSQSFAVTEQSFHSAAEEQVARFRATYQMAVDNNVTVIGSSGDSGTANGDKQGRLYSFPTANWPSSDPLVTSAGGTWLQYGWRWNPTVSADAFYACLIDHSFNTCAADYLNYDDTATQTEAVWKEDWIQAATGGGLSVLFPTPAFQAGISQNILHGRRGLPDVSWNAAVDGAALVYTSFGGPRVGWHIVGGTSASAPQLAGVVTLANQLAHQMGKRSVGYLNPLLYSLPARDFNDTVPETFGTGAGVVTLNSNALYGVNIPGMPTTAGYDLTTGLGSPRSYNFVHDLAAAVP